MKKKNNLQFEFDEEIKKAYRKGKKLEEINSLYYEACFEVGMFDEEIYILITDYLVKKSRQRFVPIPSYDKKGMWQKCDKISLRKVLTNQGVSNIRSSLREERKEQIEILVTFLTVLTGIIGALTGLFSVIMK